MTKTTNYQLPQWEANDPVRREDFNQAMAKIDAGLTQEAETLATGLADVRSEQQQDNAATKQETFRKMEIISYNLYLLLLQESYLGHRIAATRDACCNSLCQAHDLIGIADYAIKEGGGLRVGAGTELTMEQLQETAGDWADATLESTSSTGTVSVTFYCPRPGTLTGLSMWFSRVSTYAGEHLDLKARLYDLDRQTYTYTSGTIQTKVLSQAEDTAVVAMAVPLEGNRRYRLELAKETSAAWYGTFGIGTKEDRALGGTVSSAPLLQCTVTETMSLAGTRQKVVGVVRYSGNGSMPALTCGGIAMTPGDSRMVTSLSGEDCTERLYTLTGEFTGDQTVELTMTATAQQQLTVFDFGALAI